LPTSVEGWLATGERFVVMGGPGSGKSALLRYLLLDMLAEAPRLSSWAQRFGDRLPIWLPFQYFAHRRATCSGPEASLEATLEAWLAEQDESQLWPLVSGALADERLLLIVDGLDEAGEEAAGKSAAAALEVFLKNRRLPAIVSTRPYGAGHLALANRWRFASIAPLSPQSGSARWPTGGWRPRCKLPAPPRTRARRALARSRSARPSSSCGRSRRTANSANWRAPRCSSCC
jgi:energy-coupling factor transporter ATP-binding protein EcfA2